MLRALALCLAMAAALGAEQTPALPSREVVNSFLERSFGHDPSLRWEIQEIAKAAAPGMAEVRLLIKTAQGQQSMRLFVTPDGKHAVIGDLVPFGPDPFGQTRRKLEAEAQGPARGAEAGMLIVEFSDLQCPTCRRAKPTMERLLAEYPNVRFVFQHFPLQQHEWARRAAAHADCVAQQSPQAFWRFIQSVYDAQQEITEDNAQEKLSALAADSGADPAAVAACAGSADTVLRIERSLRLGQELGVTGTPTLFVNGRKITNVTGLPYAALKAVVDFELKQAAAAR